METLPITIDYTSFIIDLVELGDSFKNCKTHNGEACRADDNIKG